MNVNPELVTGSHQTPQASLAMGEKKPVDWPNDLTHRVAEFAVPFFYTAAGMLMAEGLHRKEPISAVILEATGVALGCTAIILQCKFMQYWPTGSDELTSVSSETVTPETTCTEDFSDSNDGKSLQPKTNTPPSSEKNCTTEEITDDGQKPHKK